MKPYLQLDQIREYQKHLNRIQNIDLKGRKPSINNQSQINKRWHSRSLDFHRYIDKKQITKQNQKIMNSILSIDKRRNRYMTNNQAKQCQHSMMPIIKSKRQSIQIDNIKLLMRIGNKKSCYHGSRNISQYDQLRGRLIRNRKQLRQWKLNQSRKKQ